jgi:hypothetical protein
MRWIDFENKKPTDTDIPGWPPWSKADWASWLTESERLLKALAKRDAAVRRYEALGQTKKAMSRLAGRNKFIENNSAHWGKLKPWLLALSHGKCWFTEGKEICSHYDVEHFRPKKEALNFDGTTRDGYWWLAFDYANFRIAGGVPNKKKGGYFPLHSDSRYSKSDARCEESEVPFLLDPICPTDPDLLAFDEEGNAIPTPSADNWATETGQWAKERALESIKRYKLNEHDTLPSARREVWGKVTGAIETFLKAKAAYHPVRNPAPKVTMNEKARFIRSLTKPDVELSSVARWCLLFRNDPDLSRLA